MTEPKRTRDHWLLKLAVVVLPAVIAGFSSYKVANSETDVGYDAAAKAILTLQQQNLDLVRDVATVTATVEMLKEELHSGSFTWRVAPASPVKPGCARDEDCGVGKICRSGLCRAAPKPLVSFSFADSGTGVLVVTPAPAPEDAGWVAHFVPATDAENKPSTAQLMPSSLKDAVEQRQIH